MKGILLSLLLTVTIAAVAAPSLVVLDVGEGQALLLREGRRGILIDTGHPGMAQHLLQRLSALGVEQLDYLILTHLHPDHAGGYFRLREQFPDTPLLYTGHPLPSHVRPDLVRWMSRAVMVDRHWRKTLAGKAIHWSGLTLEVLWPDSFTDSNLNRHSMVLLLRYQGLKLLFMGDADTVVEQELMARKRLPAEVDLLVVGHHGAADATSEEFLAAIRPRLAVISVDKDNIRGYPAANVVERLKRMGVSLMRTDRDGELHFKLCCDHSAKAEVYQDRYCISGAAMDESRKEQCSEDLNR